MGFDALDPRIVESLNAHRQEIKKDFNNVSLKVRNMESFKPYMVFTERFPYWTSPFGHRTSRDFKVGDRVLNMNSVMR